MRATHRHTRGWNESEALLSKSRECVVLCGAKQIQSRATPSWGTSKKLRVGRAGSGSEECVPQKEKTGSRACCSAFTKLFAWRKACILVACAFLHPPSLEQPLLPSGRVKTFQEGTAPIPRGPVNRLLPWDVNAQALRGGESPRWWWDFLLTLCLYSGRYLDQSLQVTSIYLNFSFLVWRCGVLC